MPSETIPQTLRGRAAVVTGAGRGLGRSYAIDLARHGASVVVNDMDADVAKLVVDEIADAGGSAVCCVASVASASGGREIVSTALDAFGSVDIVVNNAGQIRPAYFEDMSLDELDQILETHLRGAFFVTQPAWSPMKERGFGRVIMTSSPSGMFSHHAMANYAGAKAGLYGMTMALANEGAPYGITVNAVLPNAKTNIQNSPHPIPDFRAVLDRVVGPERLAKRSFTQSPDLVASLVSYLVAPACTITGEAYSVMAGRFARVFVGVTSGWYPDDLDAVTAESVAEHIDAIRARDEYSVPGSIFEEMIAAIDGIPQG
jgi:NAD(P)-dependent dehydrogenase (short-subunit alcohol dehydrogenase family)